MVAKANISCWLVSAATGPARCSIGDHQAKVVELDDQQAASRLIENLQRADLDPFEEGNGYQHAINQFGWDQQTLAVKLGKSPQTVNRALSAFGFSGFRSR